MQGDKTTQLDILGFVDNTHSAAAELFENALVRDRLADYRAEMLGPEAKQVNESTKARKHSAVSYGRLIA